MSNMSLLDKLGILFDVSVSSKLYILIILVLVALGLGLSMVNPKNQDKQKMLYIMITLFITVFAIVSYHASLENMLSYMMDNLFIVVYFPNIAIYIAAIIITNIILWVSIFSFKSAKPIRNLNIVIYSILTYIMILLLNVIDTKKLDIFNQESIYGNTEASALISISSTIFVVWIIFLVLYKIILIYLKKDYAPKVKRVVIKKKVKKLPENYEPVIFPDYIYGNIAHRIHDVNPIQLESRFSLEDYKLFSKILKEKKYLKFEFEENLPKNNNIKENAYREEQKKEIIKMEEERRELLEKETNQKSITEEQEISEPFIEEVEEPIKEQNYSSTYQDEDDFEIDGKEQAKLTELEMLYQNIR